MEKNKMWRALAIFSSGYAKRWMESNYDRLMLTSGGKRLMELDKKSRYAIEAVLNAAMALAEQKIPEKSAWQLLLKEIVLDAPPEISKRLINGFRENYVQSRAREASSESNLASSIALAQASPDELKTILNWMTELTEPELTTLRPLFSLLEVDQLIALGTLTAAQRSTYFRLIEKDQPRPKDKGTGRTPEISRLISEARTRVRAEHQQLRQSKGLT